MSKEKFLSENESVNPVCEICSGGHKTSQHDEYKKENLMNEIKCEICGGGHKTAAHELEMDLLKRKGGEKKSDFVIDA